jgi:hydroxyacylglutathione hydrolase
VRPLARIDGAGLFAEPAAERVPVAGHPSVEPIGAPGKRLREERHRRPGGEEPGYRAGRGAAGVSPTVGRGEVPRREPVAFAEIGEKPIAFVALDRGRTEAASTIPAEQTGESPSTEAAVLVVEHEVTFHVLIVRSGAAASGRPVRCREMYLDVFDRNPFGTNCWLLAADEGEDVVVVDPGFEPLEVRSLLERAGRRPVAVLLTHAHIDHAYAAGDFAGDDVPVFIHQDDAVAFEDIEAWGSGFDNPLTPVKDLRRLTGDEDLSFAGLSIGVRHTPGHTPGHCCFVTDATVLSGDLVFAGSIGRSDFPNSSSAAMRRSLKWFLTLDDDGDVLPGHGPRTTVGRERASNPFLVDLA